MYPIRPNNYGRRLSFGRRQSYGRIAFNAHESYCSKSARNVPTIAVIPTDGKAMVEEYIEANKDNMIASYFMPGKDLL
jgi:hypothetical protein